MKIKINFLYFLRYVSLIVLFLTFTGCGGGGSSDTSTTSATKTGQFIDSPVSGLQYQDSPSGKTGQTDSNGTFKYSTGDTVSFYVGDILIGSAPGAAVVSPLSLVSDATSLSDARVINIARFLQSLDVDRNPDTNGISISAAEISAATGSSLSLDYASSSFDTDAATVVNTLRGDALGLIDSNTAETHLANTIASINSAPIANAGSDSSATTGVAVALDGTGSSDPDGDPLTYKWSFASVPTGSTAQLLDDTTAKASFTPDVDGKYVVNLTVNDGVNANVTDSVVITSSSSVNQSPIANAGSDATVITGLGVTLDGTGSYDPDGDPLTYKWSFASVPTGSTAQLLNNTTATTVFIPDVDGIYTINLTVNDGVNPDVTDSVVITASSLVTNHPPIANAGNDLAVTTGTSVTLDGTGSSDPDGDPLIYNWSFVSVPTGSTAQLLNDTTANPSFTPDVDGTYVVNLSVNDGVNPDVTDSVTITASPIPCADPPVANAGVDMTVYTGNTVTLNGSQSTICGNPVPDVGALTYKWSFANVPTGSTAQLLNDTTTKVTFTPDLAGAYIMNLTIHDGVNADVTDSVTVTASAMPTFSDGLSVYNTVTADFASYASTDITVKAPDIAENGAVVPITVNFPPKLGRLWLFYDTNDDKIAAKLDVLVAEGSGYFASRIKMKQTGNIIAVFDDGVGNMIAVQKNVVISISGSPVVNPLDCTLVDPVFSGDIRTTNKTPPPMFQMLITDPMDTGDYINNIMVKVNNMPVASVDFTPYVSTNPYLAVGYLSSTTTTDNLSATVNATCNRTATANYLAVP